ncbi:MAG TPA: phosphoglycerate kinase [Desulfobacteraceae bacterium]|nr:phosphoglycerate kinase [Desulfobacteraceae bacterium]
MKSVRDIALEGKRIFVRVDYNLPMDEHLTITDDNRIKATLPLIDYLVDNNARVILASHMGRPGGKTVPELSLAPAARRLTSLLNREVAFFSNCIGKDVEEKVAALENGEVLLLENLRFHRGETENDPEFARALAGLCDVYVNNAFAVSHRNQASVVGMVQWVPQCAAGFLLEKELACYNDSVKNPKTPLVAIIGGAKVSSKLKALKNMLNYVDTMIIGGAMANTFLKGCGIDTKGCMVEEDLGPEAAGIVETAQRMGVTLLLPHDLVVAEKLDKDAVTRVVSVNDIPDGHMGLDIGHKTAAFFAAAVKNAGTIVWNGPMGVFEMEAFRNGTRVVAHAVAASRGFSVVGGGDTGLAVNVCGVADQISYISTGGGAFLRLMEGEELPGVAALEK